jgi:hypothetical protein
MESRLSCGEIPGPEASARIVVGIVEIGISGYFSRIRRADQ